MFAEKYIIVELLYNYRTSSNNSKFSSKVHINLHIISGIDSFKKNPSCIKETFNHLDSETDNLSKLPVLVMVYVVEMMVLR
ncbi:4511_t:CDS:2, partial [Funneliformis caledonium]